MYKGKGLCAKLFYYLGLSRTLGYGGVVSIFWKMVRVGNQPIFPLAYMCPTQDIFLDFLAAPKTSLVLLSLLLCFPLSLFLLATPYLFFDFLKETRRLKKLSPSFIPIVQHQEKEKLSTLLALSHLWVQQQGKRFLSILLKLLFPTWS